MDGGQSSDLIFFLNGRKVIENNPCPKTQLVEYLREKLNLRGTKIGCSEGGCGSCTVMVSKCDRKTQTIQHEARYACLTLLCTLHGTAVTTIEALGSTRTGMHKLQEYLVTGHGVQCGFCSPGMIMSMYALIRNKINPTDLEIENALKGNLCRCTGYRPILDSFKLFAKDNCPMGEKCCQNNVCDVPHDMASIPNKLCDELAKNKQELIFPNELQLSDLLDRQNLKFQNQNIIWYSPISAGLVLTYKKLFPLALVVAGGTGAVFRLRNASLDQPLIIISLSRVNDFDTMEVSDDGITIGPNVTVSAFESYLKSHLNKLSESKSRLVISLLEVCQRFGSAQIRNTSTICGGLALGAISSDINVLLLAANSKVTVLSRACERLMNIDGGFFSSKTRVRASEIIIRLFIPFPDENKYFGFFKLSPRKDFSQANLNCGFSVEFNGSPQCVVKEASFNYGGWFQKPLIMSGLAAYVRGKSWDKNMLPCCLEEVGKDFNKLKHLNLINGSAEDLDYILFSMQALFFKFFVKVLVQLSENYLNISEPCDEVLSAVNFSTHHDDDRHSGMQVYNSHVNDNLKAASVISSSEDDSLGKPLPHRWANQSTTGEAIFIDDQIPYQGELCLSLVTSTKARAKILRVDYSEVLTQPGVVGYVDHTSVQGSNIVELFEPQELFASEEVFYVGQTIAAIVARTHEQARSACRLVQVYYEECEPIITIEDAVEKHSYHTGFGEFSIKRGDTERAFMESCGEVLENEVRIGGQEHFYMETHCCRVVPLVEDGGELEVFAGCQYSAGLQQVLSNTLNIPQNKINIRVKRMGGAFGGKEMRVWLTAAPSAVAALKFNLPVRCMLTRRQDMQITGHRRPYKAKYKVGFTREGKIEALNLEMFSSDGWSPDINPIFMAMSMLNFDGVYNIPNVKAVGYSCKTNLPPCTAMRGAGVPQALFITESLISDVANYLGMPAHEVRESNMYAPESLTIANCPIENSLHRCYLEVKKQSRFEEVSLQVQDFNRKNKFVKQAVSILPIKFSPSFSPKMNKGSALINIYNDGTVLLTHGGVESGQGLHTKMIQVASHTLEISSSYIHMSETSTSTVPNAVTTGGSTGSDLNGMAVVDACQQIKNRLKPLRTSNPALSWKELIQLALKDKVNLSAVGYWNGEYNEDFNWQTGEGRFHSYYTYGSVVSRVEVDCTTGEHVILKVDIVMDVGKSLNPAIDVGQIEGGFIMGLGLCVLEDHKYSSDGTLETIGPGKYHIPTVGNLPLEMNVTLLKDSGNERAVYSSKGIGEPPLLLSTSVWLAIREVVAQVRKDGVDEDVRAGLTEVGNVEKKNKRVFQFNTPATPKHVLLACGSKNLSC